MPFTSRVEREVAAAHSNGPPGQKCHRLHGHDFFVVVEITYVRLDKWGWGPNFSVIKEIIDRIGDHQNLNEMLVSPPSAENIAAYLHGLINQNTGYVPDFVSVREGHGNTVTYRP